MVEPKYSGNIGGVARVMANFDFHNLYLVNPSCELDDECYKRAMHAQEIVENTKVFKSFEKAIKDMDYVVATSSVESKNDKRFLRNAVSLEFFSKKIFETTGRVALVFGREDYGLLNEEIAVCDLLVRIPTSESYPSLNLSHAVGVVLYSLFIYKGVKTRKKTRVIEGIEKEKLYGFFSDLLDEIEYPIHKKENTKVLFRRVMGRAMPSKWEYHTFMGVLSKTLNEIKKRKKV